MEKKKKKRKVNNLKNAKPQENNPVFLKTLFHKDSFLRWNARLKETQNSYENSTLVKNVVPAA